MKEIESYLVFIDNYKLFASSLLVLGRFCCLCTLLIILFIILRLVAVAAVQTNQAIEQEGERLRGTAEAVSV